MHTFEERRLGELFRQWHRRLIARSQPPDQAPSTVALWRRRVRERQELALLSDKDLRDIGLSSVDAAREIEKPFWQG